MNGMTSFGEPQFERLEDRRKNEFDFIRLDGDVPRENDFKENNLALRLRRSVSWLGRAEVELFQRQPSDPDAAFVFYWIAFNATYAEDSRDSSNYNEAKKFNQHLRYLALLDGSEPTFSILCKRFSMETSSFLNNRFVFDPFWKHNNGVSGFDNWRQLFDNSVFRANRALDEGRSSAFLRIIFDRMYVLRNQIIHGGATWDSSVNRSQVEDGARIMAFLVPRFIELMMDNPSMEWGDPYYPRVYV